VQTLASSPTLCSHGPGVKTNRLRCVLPNRLRVAINLGILGHVLRMCDPIRPLGFVSRVFRGPYQGRSGTSEGYPYQGGGAR